MNDHSYSYGNDRSDGYGLYYTSGRESAVEKCINSFYYYTCNVNNSSDDYNDDHSGVMVMSDITPGSGKVQLLYKTRC